MTVVDEYLASLNGPEKETIQHMYGVIRQAIPNVTEELSYRMPAFKYKGKAVVAVMANKHFLSLYPFGAVEKLDLDLSGFECTSGSIHFSADKPISDDLLRQIVTARLRQIG